MIDIMQAGWREPQTAHSKITRLVLFQRLGLVILLVAACAPRPSAGHGRRVKVVGERNTGTNWAERVVRDNVRNPVISGVRSRHYKSADRFFSENWCATLGWKHGFPPTPSQLATCPAAFDRCGNTSFVLMVKNPYAWMLSMYRHPYEVRSRATFDAFVKAPIHAPARENANVAEHKNLARLWNVKYQAWLTQLPANCVTVVKYENLLRNRTVAFKEVFDALALDYTMPLTISTVSTKQPRTHRFRDYAAYYLHEQWASAYGPELLRWLHNGELDLNLTERLGYSRLLDRLSK